MKYEKKKNKMKAETYCGIKCIECPIYISTIKNDYKLKIVIIEKWGYTGKLKVEKIQCNGCKSANTFKYCEQCDIKRCCLGKKKDACIQCHEYICIRLEKLYKNCNEYMTKMN